MTGELTAEEMLSAWGSAEVKNTFFVPGNVRIQRTLLCQALFLDILKVPGIVRMQRTLLFQVLLMEKVPGKMRKQRTLLARHFFIKILKKCL